MGKILNAKLVCVKNPSRVTSNLLHTDTTSKMHYQLSKIIAKNGGKI